MKKILQVLLVAGLMFVLVGCLNTTTTSTKDDIKETQKVSDKLTENQPTPTDINYSLERYNLIKRAYWVNGQRDKALSLQSTVELPLGYIVLFSGNTIVAQFTVQGKVSSLNSYLTPDMIQKGYNNGGVVETELPDIDGSYGENDNGIFFFTPDGKYVEWTGEYLYTDYFITIKDPVIIIGGN